MCCHPYGPADAVRHGVRRRIEVEMLARWECPVCAETLVALGERGLRSVRGRHEVACCTNACLAWQDDMRAQHRAIGLIAPESPQSSTQYLVDLRHKIGA
jgi:hypothetical protein